MSEEMGVDGCYKSNKYIVIIGFAFILLILSLAEYS